MRRSPSVDDVAVDVDDAPAGEAAAAGVTDAASTSALVTRPAGPLPVTWARSTPFSFASCRTKGAARTSTLLSGTEGSGFAPNAGFGAGARAVAHERSGRDLGRRPLGCRDGDERLADGNRLAGTRVQLLDGAGPGRGNHDDGLRRLDIAERRVDLHPGAFHDLPGHQLSLGQTLAQVGEPEGLISHRPGQRRRPAECGRHPAGRASRSGTGDRGRSTRRCAPLAPRADRRRRG